MDIYQPAEDSYLLQRYVKKHAFGRVLDLGTGSGIQALTAAECKVVKEVVAVDINEQAVERLKKEVLSNKLKTKIKANDSDLFSNVQGKFDTILFNPPYLPEDKIGKEIVEDSALYGGKHGWELSEKFFNLVSKYLVASGKILFLFSSLTNKEKIEEIIFRNLFEFEELASEKLPMFETLYVYLIEKSKVLRELERKNVMGVKYLTHGKRGNIFVGNLDKSKRVKTHFAKKEIVKVGIKVKRKESTALQRMENEAKWLKVLNKKGIGPHFLFSGEGYLVYEFVEGKFILDWIKNENKKEILKVLVNVLEQCYILDQLGVNKEEMHHPLKHVVVDKFNVPVLLDFERCNRSEKVKNVTQFVEFISRMRDELEGKNIKINKIELRENAKEYKREISKESFKEIIRCLSS